MSKANRKLERKTSMDKKLIDYSFTDFEYPCPMILQSHYLRESNNGCFLKEIERLNSAFGTSSDKYIKVKVQLDRINDSLFMNLFKQITIYIKEIDRLNRKLKEKDKEREIDIHSKKDCDSKSSIKMVAQYKTAIKSLESKLNEKNMHENQLVKEVESCKKQIDFYQTTLNRKYQSQEKDKRHHYNVNVVKNKPVNRQVYQKITNDNNRSRNVNQTLNTTVIIKGFGGKQYDSLDKINYFNTENDLVYSDYKKMIFNSKTPMGIDAKKFRTKSFDESQLSCVNQIDKMELETLAKDYNDIVNQELDLLNIEEELLEDLVDKYSSKENIDKTPKKEPRKNKSTSTYKSKHQDYDIEEQD